MFALPVIAGFAIGAVFGVVGLLSGFCLMSSLRDWWAHDDGRKIRSYALALAVAVVGTQFIAGAGIVEIEPRQAIDGDQDHAVVLARLRLRQSGSGQQ